MGIFPSIVRSFFSPHGYAAHTQSVPSKNAQLRVFNTVKVTPRTHALQIKVVYVFRIGKNSVPMPFEWAKDTADPKHKPKQNTNRWCPEIKFSSEKTIINSDTRDNIYISVGWAIYLWCLMRLASVVSDWYAANINFWSLFWGHISHMDRHSTSWCFFFIIIYFYFRLFGLIKKNSGYVWSSGAPLAKRGESIRVFFPIWIQ